MPRRKSPEAIPGIQDAVRLKPIPCLKARWFGRELIRRPKSDRLLSNVRGKAPAGEVLAQPTNSRIGPEILINGRGAHGPGGPAAAGGLGIIVSAAVTSVTIFPPDWQNQTWWWISARTRPPRACPRIGQWRKGQTPSYWGRQDTRAVRTETTARTGGEGS